MSLENFFEATFLIFFPLPWRRPGSADICPGIRDIAVAQWLSGSSQKSAVDFQRRPRWPLGVSAASCFFGELPHFNGCFLSHQRFMVRSLILKMFDDELGLIMLNSWWNLCFWSHDPNQTIPNDHHPFCRHFRVESHGDGSTHGEQPWWESALHGSNMVQHGPRSRDGISNLCWLVVTGTMETIGKP